MNKKETLKKSLPEYTSKNNDYSKSKMPKKWSIEGETRYIGSRKNVKKQVYVIDDIIGEDILNEVSTLIDTPGWQFKQNQPWHFELTDFAALE